MAINKARTPIWMKVVLIVLAIVFVFGFVSIGASPFMNDQTQQTTPGTGSLDAVNSQFGPTVQSLTGLLQSEPESYTVLVNLGNTYFDWAIAIQQESQNTSAAIGADLPIWVASADAYRRALVIQPGEPPVTVDFAIALFYTGDTANAIKNAEAIAESTPDFAPAFFNLGVFYGAINESDKAIAAFERYLELDPEGTQGNADFAKSQIETLRSAGTTATP